MSRWGLTIPVTGLPLPEHREIIADLTALGYTDAWSAEVSGADAFTPLALASQWGPDLRLGPAIVPVYTRGPALPAQHAATLADLAPGRFVLGIGSSSDTIVERWNGIPFDEPYRRTRDTLRFLREALAGKHEWLGRGGALRPMNEAWAAGDRKRALEAIPDELVDDLLVHGTPADCRARVREYVRNGLTTPILAIVPSSGLAPAEAVRALAPATA